MRYHYKGCQFFEHLALGGSFSGVSCPWRASERGMVFVCFRFNAGSCVKLWIYYAAGFSLCPVLFIHRMLVESFVLMWFYLGKWCTLYRCIVFHMCFYDPVCVAFFHRVFSAVSMLSLFFPLYVVCLVKMFLFSSLHSFWTVFFWWTHCCVKKVCVFGVAFFVTFIANIFVVCIFQIQFQSNLFRLSCWVESHNVLWWSYVGVHVNAARLRHTFGHCPV